MDAIWSLSPEQDDALTDRVYQVQLALAELSDRLLTVDEFRAQIGEILRKQSVQPAA